MAKEDLIKRLCSKYCSYYKPSKDEELACLGFLLAQRLAERSDLFAVKGTGGAEWQDMSDKIVSKLLREKMCPACPFYDGDCDFILTDGRAEPCGGFIFFIKLIEEDSISINDVVAAVRVV